MTPLEQVLPILEQLSREDKILAIERLTCLLNQEEVQARFAPQYVKGSVG